MIFEFEIEPGIKVVAKNPKQAEKILGSLFVETHYLAKQLTAKQKEGLIKELKKYIKGKTNA